jgi:hypothetical protein
MSGEKRTPGMAPPWWRGPKPVGFPKPEIRGKGSFTPPKPKTLDSSCEPGDYVITEDRTIGILKNWRDDLQKAIIQKDNGSLVEVDV